MKSSSLPEICESECSLDVRKVGHFAVGGTAANLECFTDLFFALSDPSRLRILLSLNEGHELCVCDIAALLNVSVSSASHHLRKMKDLGILSNRSDGKLVYYSLSDGRVGKILNAVMG